MTANKPEVVAWWDGESSITRNVGRPASHNWHQRIDLIRLSDYEALQAECALMREQLDAMAEYKVAAHQLIGIPASVGISEPIEGFAKRPQDIMPAVRDMALRIELLEHQAAERERLLAESRANDQQAMAYLSEVRALVGGDDFPDMVRRCEKLREHLQNLIYQTTPLEPAPGNPMWSRRIQLDEVMAERDGLRAECEKLRAAIRRLCNIYVVDDYYEGQLREERLESAVNRAIDAAMEGDKP